MVEMKSIGYVGIINDQLTELYQCPRCKGVQLIPWIDGGIQKCPDCIGIK